MQRRDKFKENKIKILIFSPCDKPVGFEYVTKKKTTQFQFRYFQF